MNYLILYYLDLIWSNRIWRCNWKIQLKNLNPFLNWINKRKIFNKTFKDDKNFILQNEVGQSSWFLYNDLSK